MNHRAALAHSRPDGPAAEAGRGGAGRRAVKSRLPLL